MAYDKVVDSAVLDAGLTAICNKIRDHLGAPPEYKLSFPNEMAEAVTDVYSKGNAEGYSAGTQHGFESGYNAGYGTGKGEAEAANAQILADCNTALTEKGVETASTLEQVPTRIGEIEVGSGAGYDEGYADGKQAEYNSFWDNYLGGDITHQQAFAGERWTDDTYNPNKTIVCTKAATNMYNSAKITDTKVPIELRCANANTMFAGCNKLVTIRYLGFFGVTSSSSMFTSCSALENITCDGEINSAIGFASCSKLSDTSIQSIIDHLADLTGKTALKVGFHSDVISKLTTVQTDTILAKNWYM